MHLNSYLYQKLVRPKFAVEKYIKNVARAEFDFTGAKVLDFGCGTGANAFLFEAENYLGVDVDKGRIDFAKRAFPEYDFLPIEKNILPAAVESFDFICIFAAIHHISDDDFRSYLKEFCRVLKPGGRLVAIEPVLYGERRLSDWFMRTFDDGKFIRSEKQYLDLFGEDFSASVHKRFNKFFLYSEVFFSANKKSPVDTGLLEWRRLTASSAF